MAKGGLPRGKGDVQTVEQLIWFMYNNVEWFSAETCIDNIYIDLSTLILGMQMQHSQLSQQQRAKREQRWQRQQHCQYAPQ